MTIQFRVQNACPGRDTYHVAHLLDLLVQPPPASQEDASQDDASEASGESPADSTNPLDTTMELAPIVGKGFDLPPYNPTDGSRLCAQERITLLTEFQASFLASPAAADDQPDEFDPASESTPES